MTAQDGETPAPDEPQPVRRDFLTLLTVATATVGAGGLAWPFLDSLNSASTGEAADMTVDVDLSPLAPGQQLVATWRGYPVFVVRRTPDALRRLQEASLLTRLRDPHSTARQQPAYAVNWHRSLVPEFGVMVGICTHLGCVPRFRPPAGAAGGAEGGSGGYACPCHGSRFDLAGRVYVGAPAQYNLPVPPYAMLSPTRLRLGDTTQDVGFDFDGIAQI